jgi:hypothetical protein
LLAKGGILKGRHCIGGFTAVGDASKHAFICQKLPLFPDAECLYLPLILAFFSTIAFVFELSYGMPDSRAQLNIVYYSKTRYQ